MAGGSPEEMRSGQETSSWMNEGISFFFSPFSFYFCDVVHERAAEHGVQLDLVVLQDVLEGAAGAILCEEAAMRRRDAGANEAYQMIVGHIFHLDGATLDKSTEREMDVYLYQRRLAARPDRRRSN